MFPAQTVKMTREGFLAIERSMAQKLLDGTLLNPTACCLACGERVQVREGTIERVDVRRPSDRHSIFLSEIAVCSNGACGQVAVRLGEGMSGRRWSYGASEVVCIEGAPFTIREMSIPISRKQKENYTRFLSATA